VNFNWSDRGNSEQLLGYLFQSEVSPVEEQKTFSLTCHRETEQNSQRLDAYTSTDVWTWWRPIPLKFVWRLTLAGAFIATIVSLKVVLHFSQRDRGLGDIVKDDWLHYTWTIVPTCSWPVWACTFLPFISTLKR